MPGPSIFSVTLVREKSPSKLKEKIFAEAQTSPNLQPREVLACLVYTVSFLEQNHLASPT